MKRERDSERLLEKKKNYDKKLKKISNFLRISLKPWMTKLGGGGVFLKFLSVGFSFHSHHCFRIHVSLADLFFQLSNHSYCIM